MGDSAVHSNGNSILADLIGATYARISTAKQKDGISLDDQDIRMALYARHNDISVPEEYRFKEQESGFKEERSEYEKIRELIRKRRINVLIVYGSDRHTRDPIHGDIFRAELRRNSVGLHIITEGGEVDIISPTGQFFRRQMDNFNWYWGKIIQSTTQEKKKAYTQAGVPLQQGFAKFAYRRVGKQAAAQLEIDPADAGTVRDVFTLFDEGMGVRDIGRRLDGRPTPGDRCHSKNRQRAFGVWSDATIYQILRDEIYAGMYYANRYAIIEDEYGEKKRIKRPRDEWVPIPVPAIISQEVWERCQDRLKSGKVSAERPHAKYEYLLARRCKCRTCAYGASGNTIPGTHRAYYICNSKLKQTVKERCALPFLRVDAVDRTVWAFTRKLLEDKRALLAAMQEAQQEQQKQHQDILTRIAEIDALIMEQTADLDLLVRDYRTANRAEQNSVLFEVLKQQASEIEAHIAGLKKRKAKLEAKLQGEILSDEDIAALDRFATEVRPRLATAAFATKREVIEALHFTFELAIEGTERVVYILWYTHEFRRLIENEAGGEDMALC